MRCWNKLLSFMLRIHSPASNGINPESLFSVRERKKSRSEWVSEWVSKEMKKKLLRDILLLTKNLNFSVFFKLNRKVSNFVKLTSPFWALIPMANEEEVWNVWKETKTFGHLSSSSTGIMSFTRRFPHLYLDGTSNETSAASSSSSLKKVVFGFLPYQNRRFFRNLKENWKDYKSNFHSWG